MQDLKSKLSNLGKARARLPKVDEAIKKAEVRVTLHGARHVNSPRFEQQQIADCNDRILRMEEEHNQMGDVNHITAQRAELKAKMRSLDQDIEALHVRRPFLFRSPLPKPSRYHVLRVNRNESTAV